MRGTMIRWAVVLVLVSIPVMGSENATGPSVAKAEGVVAGHGGESFVPLRELLERTLRDNPRIRDARDRLRAAETLMPQAKSQLLPSVAIEWDNTLSSSRWQGGSSQSDPTSATLSVSQPLFDLETMRDFRRMVPYVKAAAMDLEAVRQKVFLEFLELATALIQEQEVAALSEKNHTLTQAHLDATRIRFEAGELTRTDVSQSLARVYAAKAGWIAAKANVAARQAGLSELVSGTIPEPLELPPIRLELLRNSWAELELLLEKRPDLEAERQRVEVERMNVEARRAGYLPTASLDSTGARTWDPSSGVAGPENDLSVTVKVSWPLYSGGLTGAQIDEAIANRDARQSNLERLRLSAQRELKVALLDHEKFAAEDQANEVRVTAARDALDGVTREHQVGTRTSLDLLDAQNEFFSAETEKVKSRHGVNLARFRILGILGMLSWEALASRSGHE
ncbi:MAG: TolC family outer membrane protein [Magnetococcales bacterium]|nr:TolC family outer membrane protein [Magnetococcales bacterium]